MRIVSGHFRGRAIYAPTGKATRPTSDRARQSLFNILGHAAWAPALEGARVLDVFAGSGALGLEALSRGAATCLFVESARPARAAIQSNVAALGLTSRAFLHARSATDLGQRSAGIGEAFDLAFIDPPYGKDLIAPSLRSLIGGNWLTDDALLVIETSADEAESDLAPDWQVLDTRTMGAARISFVRRA